jgi:hypothetical protein
MADDDPIQELHAQGKGRWIVETLTSRQNTSGLEAIELITKWRAQVHEGANPICACCDFRWTNLEMALPAAFFLARPAVPDPSGALLCGVCADCVVQKDMRREVERWFATHYRGKVVFGEIRDYERGCRRSGRSVRH